MYTIAKVPPEKLKEIPIQKQAEILALTKSELDLTKGYEIIKAESKGFSKEEEKAQLADQMLSELLKKRGVEIEQPAKKETKKAAKRTKVETKSQSDLDRLRLRERERIRKLELLELEMELNKKSA